MKKHVKIAMLLSLVTLMTTNLSSQTYTIISRNNQDSILLFPNKAGAALKSLASSLPGAQKESEPLKFLVKKVENGKESLIFIDFVNTLDKYFVTYETDMTTPVKWLYKGYGFKDIYSSLTRKNAIYLEGSLLGIHFEIHQRPEVYSDMIRIDNTTLIASPIKINLLEKTIAEEGVQHAQREQERLPKLIEIGIPEDVAKDAIANPDPYYLAYLIKSTNFNTKYREDLRSRADGDKIIQLVKIYTIDQLMEMGKGYNKELKKYEYYSATLQN